MFEKIELFFEKLFTPTKSIPTGIYQYQSADKAEIPFRLHLRIEDDGNGILIINASTVLHLNRTATEYAFYLVNGKDDKQIAGLISEKYEVYQEKALEDYHDFLNKLDTLVQTPDLDPVSFLDMERINPYSEVSSAPYRLDCALTYQVSDFADEKSAPMDRVERELTTQEWQTIMKKAWDAGIPHIVFTGGEPTKRDDLLTLIRYAEDLGMVTGLLTDGAKLSQKKFLNKLLQSGLDHIMLLCNHQEKYFWKSLQNIIPVDLANLVHITIDKENAEHINTLLEKLHDYGVKNVSLSTYDIDLYDRLQQTSSLAQEMGFTILWDLPVPYSNLNPISLELMALDKRIVEGAGKAWLYVEPDGDVLPAQGINKILGNMLRDPWGKIWRKKR